MRSDHRFVVVSLLVLTACQPAGEPLTGQVEQAGSVAVHQFSNRWWGADPANANIVRYFTGTIDRKLALPSNYPAKIDSALTKYDVTPVVFERIPHSTSIADLIADPEPHLIYLTDNRDPNPVSQTQSFSSLQIAANDSTDTFHATAKRIFDAYGPEALGGNGIVRAGNCPHTNDPLDPGTATTPQHPCRHDDFIIILKPNLYPGGDHVVIHETGHALGLAHEQSREDRCNHVAVFSDCMDPNLVSQSLEAGPGIQQNLSPYDIQSIMQYGSTLFCNTTPCDPTCLPMISRQSAPNATVAQSQDAHDDCGGNLDTGTTSGFVIEQTAVLSNEDINVVHEMYPPKLGTHGRGAFASAMVAADFDSDGYADLAVGAPDADGGRGRVFLYKGTFTGLIPWGTIDEPGTGRLDGDRFGASLAVIDLAAHVDSNPLGIPPNLALVVGAPRRRVGGQAGAGEVYVFSAFDHRGQPASHQSITAASLGAAASQANDYFGTAVAAGFINDRLDGFVKLESLAIGAPGAHHVYVANRSGGWTLATRLGGNRSVGEAFGSALAIGDLDEDGFGDLVIGAPDSEVGGRIFLARGEAASTGTFSSIRAIGEPTLAELQDQFGAAVAIGRFGNEPPSVVVGAPGRSGGAGGVFVFGPGFGATLASERTLAEFGNTNVSSGAFGATLIVGNLDATGFDDLVVGAPEASVNDHAHTGCVGIFLGRSRTNDSAIRLIASGVRFAPLAHHRRLDPDASRGPPQNFEHFGSALALGDFDHRRLIGQLDLAIGSPGREDEEGVGWVLRGRLGALPTYVAAEKVFTTMLQRGIVELYRH